MSIRRKRRQRGKRKALRIEALKTWERLSSTSVTKPVTGFPGLISMVRRTMPSTIASTLVGVQPMSMPACMIGNVVNGIEPVRFRYDKSKKTISEQRKKERAAKKRKRSNVAKAQRAKARPCRDD